MPRAHRRLAALLAAVAAAPLLSSAPVTPAAATAPDASPRCDRRSWVAGSVDLCDGALIYRDYVYDDYGADDPLVPSQSRSTTGSLARPAGDARYPTGAENTADLVDLTLKVVGDRLQATFEVGALYEPDSTVAALAIDTDDDRTTGGGAWKRLGVSSDGWDVLATFDRGDPRTNLITGSIPLPAGRRWRVQAVTAQADGTVMNVAFRGTRERTVVGSWFEDKQAAALADGDISAFGLRVRVADLRAGVTRRARLTSGYHSRVYTSRYTLRDGEGMSYRPEYGRHGNTGNVCEQAFHFFGKYQPYGIYVPDQRGPHGVQLALHGCNANHSSLVDQPGMQQQFGEDLNRLVVVPLGRGPIGFYSDISERDVLDVLADVRRSYRVDGDKVFSGGYSMGGYGAYRFAMLYPHRFAGMANWVGFTGDCTNLPKVRRVGDCASGAIGNVIDFVGNLRHVPSALLYAGGDELVHASSAQAMAQEFRDHEVPYEFFFHPAAEHLTFALLDDWKKEAAYTDGLERVRRPRRVTYRTDPSLAAPQFGIRHDRASWVRAIRGRDEGYVDVDAVSGGCGNATPTYTTGVDAGVGPAALPWVSDYRTATGAQVRSPANTLRATLGNVDSLRIDVAQACLSPQPVRYRIVTDGPTTIRLSDGRRLHFPKAGTFTGVLRRA